MIDDPKSLLESLRWKEDIKVTNRFGEHVWLKSLFVDEHFRSVDPETTDANKIGITDCCRVDQPCPRHKAMQEHEDAAVKN